MNTHTGYMLDTNVFNHVLDGQLDIASLGGIRLIATHIQRDEIANTKDTARREALLSMFKILVEDNAPTSSAVAGVSVAGGACASSNGIAPTESAVYGVSRFGQAKWGANDDIFTGMRRDLDALNKRIKNNAQDILIAETSLRNGWVLITSDADLFAIVTKYGGACANAFALPV